MANETQEALLPPIAKLDDDAGMEEIFAMYNSIHKRTEKAGEIFLVDVQTKAHSFMSAHFGALNRILLQQGEELVVLRTMELMLRRGIGTPEDFAKLFALLSSFREGLNAANKPTPSQA